MNHFTDSTQAVFDTSNYRLFVLPVVSRIFPVRDAQIRLVLLHYFPHFVGLMDPDHLVQNILPEVPYTSYVILSFFRHLLCLAVAVRHQRHR